MAEKTFQMRRKLADGNFDDYFPITKAANVKAGDGTISIEDLILYKSTDRCLPYDPKICLGLPGFLFTSALEGGTTLYGTLSSNGLIHTNDLSDKGGATLMPLKSPFGNNYPYHHTDGYVYFFRDNYHTLYRALFADLSPTITASIVSGSTVLNAGNKFIVFIGGQLYVVRYGVNDDWTTKLYSATWGVASPTLIATIATSSSYQVAGVATDGTYIYILQSTPSGNHRILKVSTSGVIIGTYYLNMLSYSGTIWLSYSGTPGIFYLIYMVGSQTSAAKINL